MSTCMQDIMRLIVVSQQQRWSAFVCCHVFERVSKDSLARHHKHVCNMCITRSQFVHAAAEEKAMTAAVFSGSSHLQ